MSSAQPGSTPPAKYESVTPWVRSGPSGMDVLMARLGLPGLMSTVMLGSTT